MNRSEQTKVKVLNEVAQGALTAKEGANLLGLSLRHTRRLLAAYRREGVAAIAHGNRGRRPAHTTDQGIRQHVIELAQVDYAGCNQHHFTDLLAEREGLALSRSTIRRILLHAGIRSPRTHRVPEHRQRRERYPQEGMLIQIDGSPHAWLEKRGPRLCLLAAVDDATGAVHAVTFRPQEDAHGYLILLQQLVQNHGRPLAVYHDRHSIFIPPAHQKLTLDDQLTGRSPSTQVARALEELSIGSVAAHSPQAKGRIERLFGSFQDRLVSELRLAGARTIEEANSLLASFVGRYNQQFTVPAKQAGTAYRPLETENSLEQIFCFKYHRTVGADNTVRLGEHRLQLLPGPRRMSYAKTRVEIHERLDGSVVVYHQGHCLASQPAPQEAPVLRARPNARSKNSSRGAAAVVVGSGDMWAGSHTNTSEVPDDRPPIPTPHRPTPTHPWRQSYKTMRVTKSLNS